jgi:hypothetical protein
MILGYLLYDFSLTCQVCDFFTHQCDGVLDLTLQQDSPAPSLLYLPKSYFATSLQT